MKRLKLYMRTRLASKLVAMMLSIAVVFTMLPVAASAEDVVAAADISIGTAAPYNGAAIADGAITFGGGSTTSVQWSANGGAYAAASGFFAQSTIYRTRYVFTADSSHVFDPAAGAYQQGGARDLSGSIANLGAGTFTATVSQAFTLNDTLTITVTWPNATIEPSDISIGTVAPVKGAAIEDGTNSFAHATAVVTWSTNGTSFNPASGVFAPGTTYFTKYEITADAGYAFDTTSRIYNDGAKSLASRIFNLGTSFLAGANVSTKVRAGDTLTVFVMWNTTATATGQTIIEAGDIRIGTAAPAPSVLAANGTNTFNHATVDYIEWFDQSVYFDEGTASFVSGKTYKSSYAILPANGYAFDTPFAYTKGQSRDLSSRISNLGTGTFYVYGYDEGLLIEVTWPQTGLIVPADLSIGTVAPLPAASMADGANTFGHAAASIKWSADNGATFDTASGAFAYETTYQTQYVITAASGYFFDAAAGAYEAGGAKALTSRMANLGSGTYTAVVSGASKDTLTITVTWPKTASAPQTTIAASGLSIGTAAPATGSPVADGANSFAHASASVSWSADNGASYAAASGTFAPGRAYKSKYVLTADAGYIFDATAGAYDGIAVANLGAGSFAAVVSTTSTANDTLTITVTWPATAVAAIAASDLSIGTVAPASGEQVADGTNAFDHASAVVAWSSDGGVNYAAASGVFDPNTVYKTKYVLTAASGYAFQTAANAYDDVSVAHIGGGSLSASVSTAVTANDTLTIVVTWPVTGPATIAAADLSIGTAAPVTGAAQANGTNTFAHGSAVVAWSGDGGATYAAASGTFAPMTAYKTKYVLTAAAGYVFDSTAGVYNKNGARDLSARIASLGTGTFAATVSTTTAANDTLTLIVSWPVTNAIKILPSDLTIGTLAPVTGAAQANGSSTFAHATASIAWSADNGASYQPASGLYALGTSYKTRYVLTAASGYQFDTTAGAYAAIGIANLGAGTFTAQVSTTSAANDTLTIVVSWPATAISDTLKLVSSNATDFQAYSGSTIIPEQGLTAAAEEDYTLTLVNRSIDSSDPSAPLVAAVVGSLRVIDDQGNNVLKGIQKVSSGVAQNHPWSLKLTIGKNTSASVRNLKIMVVSGTGRRVDIRNLIGFASPTLEYAILPNPKSAFPYEYGNYYYFETGDRVSMKTSSFGLIPAGVQLVGKQTSKTTPVTNTLFDTTNYQFGYTFTMPNEPAFLSVTSTDGKAAHDILVKSTISGAVSPSLSGGSTFVKATGGKPATDHSGDIVTVDLGSYNTRIYKVKGIEVRSELLNVTLPVTANGNGTYSFAMPFTDAIVTVLVDRIVSNPLQTEIVNNASAQVDLNLDTYYPGDALQVQIANTDPTKFVASIQVWRVIEGGSIRLKQGKPADPYASQIVFGTTPYPSDSELTAGATLKVVVQFGEVTVPVSTNSAAQFSNYPAQVRLNEAIKFSFAPPADTSKIYSPAIKLHDAVTNTSNVYPCTYVKSDPQDQTKSVYTCPAVTKSRIDSVELLYDSVDAGSPTSGAAKLRNISSIAPNSRLAGVFKTIVVFGANMDGKGQVYIGTSPNPTLPAALVNVTAASLVINVPASMLSSTEDVTYYVSANGVQRSITIASAQNLSHTEFGYMAIVSNAQFNHSVLVAESEKALNQQLGNRKALMTLKGSFKSNANRFGEYNFSGTTIVNGGLTSYLPTADSKLRVFDSGDGDVSITMDDVNLIAGTYSLLKASDGSIELEKGIEYVDEYAKDSDGDLLDPGQRNIEIAIGRQNKLIVLGSGMQAGITGATLLGNAIMFDGKVYFGMALPGSGNVGFGLTIDRLQYGMNGQGSLDFQGVKADGYFTPGNDMSKKLLGGFGIGATAEGSIDTFENEYAIGFDVDAKLANFAASMSMKKNGANGLFIPDTIKIVVGLSNGIPVTPMVPIAQLTRIGGGVSGLADTITGNYKGVAPIMITINGDLEVGSLVAGEGLLEFNDVELAIGPSGITLSGNPTLLKMELFDKFKAGIYITNTSVSYQMDIAANILKNFSVILAGGNANLTYYRNNGFNLNGQLYGRLQIPEIDVGLFDIGPYTLANQTVGLSNSNAYAAFSILGFGLKVNYSFGSGSVSVGRRSLMAESTGQAFYDEDGNAVGQLNAFSNVSVVASSGTAGFMRGLALAPTTSTNDAGTVHTVTFPDGLTDDYAVLVNADPEDIGILDPEGHPYGLTYPGTLSDGTPFYDDPNANAAVVSDRTIMIRLGAQTGDWTISSSQSFDSSIIAIAPVPELARAAYDGGTGAASWDLTGLDTDAENYRVEVRLSSDNGDDPADTGAGVLIHTIDIDPAQVTDRAISGSYVFTEEDLRYLQSGTYYPRITLVGTPNADTSRSIPYSSLNAKQPMNVVNSLAPGAISAVAGSAGGGGTIHASWSGVAGADGYLVRLLDADGNAVMSPTSYTDELDGDGNPTGNRIAHAGRPIEYQISADDAVNGAFSLDFGGMESGSSYMLAVTPFALTDDSGSSYIYGATTATDVVEVPLVKMPVLHVASNLGAIASDSALGNVLAVNGDFELNIATTYIGAEDGQSRDLAAKFTVWQSDGTLDEATNMPNFTQIYASADYENHIAVPVTVDGDAGSSLIRIVAENDQGDVSEYGLAVRYSNLPPALFVDTDQEGKILTDSEGKYEIQGSTAPYATVWDSQGNRITANESGRFRISGTLSAGTQAYSTITAIDALGNVAQDDVKIVKADTGTDPGTDPGTNPGTDPGTNPGTDPGTNPGTDPGTNPGTDPGTDPGTNPGTDPGTNPGTDPGTNPGTDPGTNPGTNPNTPQTGPGQSGGQTDGGTDNGTTAGSSFKDVRAQTPWAEAAIERAYKLGIVSGRTPEQFAPKSDTRRDEAIVMLARARHLTIGVQADLDAAAAYFADWNGLAEWSKPYIAAAFAKGLVTGTVRNGKYYINGASPITRAEVAVLLQNAYRLAADASNLKSFGDTIPSWAVDSVSALASRRVINGYPDSTFMAGAHATRAEIVVMLMALIDA